MADADAVHQQSAQPSSDSDSDSDADESAQLEPLEAALAANPNNYHAHAQFIGALRKAGELERLRAAREAMSALFPLTPSMWLEWCQDEARLATSDEAVPAVEALYERGVQEYLSVPLWVEYLEFVEERDLSVAHCTVPGTSKMTALYERALAAAGLHYTEGAKVWEAYREYEIALLLSMAEASKEAKDKQIEIVRNVFRRPLRIPLADHAKILEEYKHWEQQQGIQIGDVIDELSGLPADVSLAYKKALQMCSAREPHESNIVSGKPVDGELLQHYLAYINLEEATGEPARVQILFERAVSVFPVTQDIWLKYTQYLDVNLKVASVIRGVFARGVRNCPWVGALWTKYMLALERASAPESELASVFEKALLSGIQTPNEYQDVFLTRAHVLRRRTMTEDLDSDQKLNVALLHDTFDRASQFLSTYFPDFIDRSLRLAIYWAHLEAKLLKDVIAARGVWENLIKSHGWLLEVWQSYIAMELLLGNVKEARGIYKRCYSRRLEGMGTELMCGAWLRFEEEYGSLEDYDRALLKVGPRVAEVQSMQSQQDQKVNANVPSFADNGKQGPGRSASKAKPKKDSTKNKSKKLINVPESNSRKRGLGHSESENKAKRQRGGSEVVTEPDTSLGQDTAVDRDHAMDKAVSTGKEEEKQEEETSSGMQNQTQPLSKQVVFKDECTAFLSNLSFDVTAEQIAEFFVSCGGVQEVRLLRERGTTKPRGLAYVDFKDEESLAAAVARNKEELMGRQVSIARSNPTKGRADTRGHGSVHGRGGAPSRGGGRRGGRGASIGNDEQGAEGGGRGQAGSPMISHRHGGHVKLMGTNTFAVPRNVARPLGWGNPQATSSSNSYGDDTPKSNSEFRNMFLKKG